MTHWVLHVDMDQFIAAVELLRRPEVPRRSGPSSDVEAIEQAALAALDAFTSRRPLRLLGVRAELEL